MNSTEAILPMLEYIIKGLSQHFGNKCEFVVHDYANEFTSSIVAIENGHVTGRKVGQGGTKLGLRIIQGTKNENGVFNYSTQTVDGRRLRSSTIFFKDEEGKVTCSLCINSDVTDYINARKLISNFIEDSLVENDKPDTMIFQNVDDMLMSIIKESVDHIGFPVNQMTREQKMEGISYLNSRGVFRIRNAVNIVAKFYDISRYTVYNYINEVEI